MIDRQTSPASQTEATAAHESAAEHPTAQKLQEQLYNLSVALTESGYADGVAAETTKYIQSNDLEAALQQAYDQGEDVIDVLSTIDAMANNLKQRYGDNIWTTDLKNRSVALRQKFDRFSGI